MDSKKYFINCYNFNMQYQPSEVLISVLYLCNTLTNTKNVWWWESHMMNQSSSQVAVPQAEVVNKY